MSFFFLHDMHKASIVCEKEPRTWGQGSRFTGISYKRKARWKSKLPYLWVMKSEDGGGRGRQGGNPWWIEFSTSMNYNWILDSTSLQTHQARLLLTFLELWFNRHSWCEIHYENPKDRRRKRIRETRSRERRGEDSSAENCGHLTFSAYD